MRAALSAIRPALVKMPKAQRRKVAADIAARMRRGKGRSAADGKGYAALLSVSRRRPDQTAELGRRIMASRNANHKRSV